MDYSVILDTYTIDLPDFTERYNKASNQEKVGMNIEKVISALNDRDYEYVYNKLDENFKNNNFGSIERFEDYMQRLLFDLNKAEYSDFSEEGNIYIYKLKIVPLNEESDESRNVNIIMKLLDDTDFVISFGVE